MAIQFKSAPKAASDSGGGLDFLALVNDNGQFSLVLLIVVVFAIYGIVLYLRATPGHRITDIKVKRRGSSAGAIKRTKAPAPPPEDPAETTERG
jgi:hypothetical protein